MNRLYLYMLHNICTWRSYKMYAPKRFHIQVWRFINEESQFYSQKHFISEISVSLYNPIPFLIHVYIYKCSFSNLLKFCHFLMHDFMKGLRNLCIVVTNNFSYTWLYIHMYTGRDQMIRMFHFCFSLTLDGIRSDFSFTHETCDALNIDIPIHLYLVFIYNYF